MSEASPHSGRALDGIVGAFALFTLVAHVCVWQGASLRTLCIAAGVTLLVAAAGFFGWSRARPSPTPKAPADTPLPVDPPIDPGRGLAIGLAFAAVVAEAVTGSLVWYWACGLIGVAMAGASSLRQPIALATPRRGRSTEGVLLLLSIALALCVATAHREDADDSFYTNLVVAAVDRPDAPLLAGDTLHGYPDVPMALPVFKVLTYELAQAAVTWLSGSTALGVSHVLLPPLVALLIPLAWARLAMLLLPRTGLVAVTLVVAQLLLVGDGHAAFGDFGVLRLQQGKSVMLLVVLPLCTAYAIEWMKMPSTAGFVRLAAAQIAAIGLSASGLWLGPVAAGIGLLFGISCVPRAMGDTIRSGVAGGLASLYPVGLALALRAETARAMHEAVHPQAGLSLSGPALLEQAVSMVLGTGPFRSIALFCLIAATAIASPAFRRFAIVAVGLLLVVFLDPFTAKLVAAHLSGADTYFRVLWIVPIPLLIAAVIASPLTLRLPDRFDRPTIRRGAAALLAVGALGVAPHLVTVGQQNGVELHAPGPKVSKDALDAARIVHAHSTEDDFVLLPIEVARWVPLLHQHPRPLVVREMYIDRLHDLLGPAELDRRRALAHMVAGHVRPADAGERLRAAIDDYPLEVVLISGPALGWAELRAALLDSELEIVHRDADQAIWAREPAPGPEASDREVPFAP